MTEPTLGEILINEEKIRARVDELARQIYTDYRTGDVKEIYLIPLLEGAATFCSDLGRALYKTSNGTLDVKIQSMKVESYNGTKSTGDARIVLDPKTSLKGKHVLLVEDIADTGLTLTTVQNIMKAREIASLKTVVLLDKPSRRKQGCTVQLDYIGFPIEDKFVVGYGLDYNGGYRNLPHIAVMKTEEGE